MGSKSDFWSSFDFNSNIYIEIKNKKIECPNVRMSERQGFFTLRMSKRMPESPNGRVSSQNIFIERGVKKLFSVKI